MFHLSIAQNHTTSGASDLDLIVVCFPVLCPDWLHPEDWQMNTTKFIYHPNEIQFAIHLKSQCVCYMLQSSHSSLLSSNSAWSVWGKISGIYGPRSSPCDGNIWQQILIAGRKTVPHPLSEYCYLCILTSSLLGHIPLQYIRVYPLETPTSQPRYCKSKAYSTGQLKEYLHRNYTFLWRGRRNKPSNLKIELQE